MSQPKIELLKARDFSELISDSFLFVKQNFKPLLKCFYTFCGFFLIATAAAMCMKQLRMVQIVNGVNTFDPQAARSFSRPSVFTFLGWDYVVGIFFMMLGYLTMVTTVFSYMAIYREKGRIAPTTAEVWEYIKFYYLRILGSSIVLTILMALGYVFCIIPGIYLSTVFAMVAPIIIFENTSLGYAFNQSFRLIKNNWWVTFGAIVVMSIISAACAAVAALPATLANLVVMFIHGLNNIQMSAPLALLTVLVQQVCMVFYILPVITIGLCYFSLTEVKEGTGLMGRIQNFGSTDAPTDHLPAEEY